MKPSIWTISYLYPPNFSGAGIQAYREHQKMIQVGIPVNVLTAGITIAKPLRGKQINMDGIVVKYLPIIPVLSWPFTSRFKFFYKIFFYISTHLTSISFALECASALLRAGRRKDIVNFESTDTFSIIPVLIARLKGMHPVIRMHLLSSDDPYAILKRARSGQILEYLNLSSFHAAEKVVVICTAMLESCQKANIASQKIVNIPHGVDIGLYQPVGEANKAILRQKLGLNPDKKYVIFVGAAILRKGIDVMIDSFIQIHQKRDNVNLLLIGPNQFVGRAVYNDIALQSTLTMLKKKLEAANCSDHVHWIGKVENVEEYMQVADVFCLPTRQEGFGLVIIEAMASELPVVVSQLEGVTTDIISSEQEGLIISGFEFKDYVEAIVELLDDSQKAKQMGRAARVRMISVYSLDYTVGQWASLVRELAQGKA